MDLPLFIAGRYLFSRKSHGVINLISAISAVGMAVGSAALVIILSVYNGFDSIVRESMGNIEPDLLLSPAKGKVFTPDAGVLQWAESQPGVESVCPILQDNVYISYDGKSALAKAKGVGEEFERSTPLRGKITDGVFSLHKGSLAQCVAGYGIAQKMGMSPHFAAGLEIYYPDREGNFSPTNPAGSLRSRKAFPAGLFAVNSEIDNEMVILPMELVRDLLGYGEEVSGVEIRLAPGSTPSQLRSLSSGLSRRLGPEVLVKDRYAQNESLYRMMRYEKAAIYMILVFVIIIIAFNIFGSLSMLIIEKRDDIGTLRALGAPDRMVRRIFVLEGWLISLCGMVLGVVAGVLLTLLQQRFGFIQMPTGAFLTSAYPVVLKAGDVLLCMASVAAIGYVVALLPVRRLRMDTEGQGRNF